MAATEFEGKYKEVKENEPFLSTAELVYTTLLDAIIYHRLKPGSKVRQEELADRLEISRSPVREAIMKLEQEGYIEKIAGQGYCVYQLRAKDYMHMIELRCAMESLGAKLAAERQTVEEQKELGKIMENLNEARAQNAHERMLALDEAFHRMIIKHSKNDFLVDAYEHLRPRIMFFRHFVVGEQFYLSIYQRHNGIYRAIVDRNEDLAAELITKHLMVSLEKAL